MSKQASTLVKYFFLALIALPAMDSLFELDYTPTLFENRALVSWPEWRGKGGSATQWITGMDAYFNDHFGFRRILVRVHNRIVFFVFGVSPSDKVVIGKQGWLYYAGEDAIADYRGVTRLTDEQLRRWSTHLENRRSWLAQRGIGYLLAVVPEKSTVYPEYLPDHLKQLRAENPLRQFLQAVERHTCVEPIDLSKTLIANKGKDPLYYRYDSHWTRLGAFIGYREIMTRAGELLPGLEPLSAEQFEQTRVIRKNNDLANMISLGGLLREEVIDLRPQFSYRATEAAPRESATEPYAKRQPREDLPRAVFFRTSYETANEVYFSEHFSYVKYYWPKPLEGIVYPLATVVQDDRPDIVVEIIGERSILELTPVAGTPAATQTSAATQADCG